MCALHVWVGVMSVCSLLKFLSERSGKGISFLIKKLMNAAILSVSTAAHTERSSFLFILHLIFTLHLMPRSFKPGMKLAAASQQTYPSLFFGLSKIVAQMQMGNVQVHFNMLILNKKSTAAADILHSTALFLSKVKAALTQKYRIWL